MIDWQYFFESMEFSLRKLCIFILISIFCVNIISAQQNSSDNNNSAMELKDFNGMQTDNKFEQDVNDSK